MGQIQTDQASFLLHEIYLPGLQNEHRITKSVIGAIPPEMAGYRPDEVSKTGLELAWHIAATEMRFLDAVVAGAFDLSPRPRPESIVTPEDMTRWYADNFEQRFKKLALLSGEHLAQVVDFRGVFQMSVVLYLDFVLKHSVHHRGQLSMYLRPMGAKVPAIYGESYDSAQARKAAQQGA